MIIMIIIMVCLLSINFLTAAAVCIALSICFLLPRSNKDLMLIMPVLKCVLYLSWWWILSGDVEADLPPLKAPVQVLSYADDSTMTSTHTNTNAAIQ